MTKELWLNFPAKDLTKTKDFFSKIGFTLNERQTNEKMLCFQIGANKTTVLFFPEETFKNFTKHEIADANSGAQILISFDAESCEAVDETARRVFDAGGTILVAPAEIQGWMYGFAFADLDGRRWNQIYMNSDRISQE